MRLRDLPLAGAAARQTDSTIDGAGNPRNQGVNQGERGAAHIRTRDAYREVPILVKPVWNHDIAAYFFLGGVSCGSFVLGALAGVVGGERRRALARTAHYVAFATMAPCPLLLIDDLGKPSRFHHMLRVFKPSSPMNLGAWALTLHAAFATATAARALAAEHRLPVIGDLVALLPERAVAVAGIPAALTLGGYTGVLLGTTSIPVWFKSPLLGGLFMASALSTGAAATGLATGLRGGEDPAEARAVAPLHLTLGATELALLGGYVATSGSAVTSLLRGRTGLMMAGVAASLVSATALEAVSLRASEKGRTFSAAAATATLLGGALLRWAVVRAGHDSATDREATLAAMSPSDRAPGWGATHGAQRS